MGPPDIPGWKLEAELGRGGFATVWEGRRGAERSAVKVSRLATAVARRRFAREAEAMRRVRAPAAPALIDAGEIGGLAYLVMERIGGETLASLLASRSSPPSLPWVGAVSSGILFHLAAVHRADLVHADLKPGNLRVDRAGTEVRLLDFGLAVPPGTGGAIGGTPRYAAPEQIRGESITAATDVYGFGLILYEMLAGRSPFADDLEYGHLILRPPPLTQAPETCAPRSTGAASDPTSSIAWARCGSGCRRCANATVTPSSSRLTSTAPSRAERIRRPSSWPGSRAIAGPAMSASCAAM